ncbi:FAD-dependent oxidoreductase [Cellulomonas sp. JZ18]|nr:FAD-dependent oxidoreductase [Cellulomonas sp. JZ18]
MWWDRLVADDPAAARARPPLDGDTTADVVVVGAGTTGVWTAYYLLEADPSLDVLVLDAGLVGAAGGGRATGAAPAGPVLADALRTASDGTGTGAAGRTRRALRAALQDAVVEVGGVLAAEQVDAGFRYGGLVTLARTGPAVDRIASRAAAAPATGDDVRLLDALRAQDHVRAADVLAATWTPDAAHVDPVRLLRGLAQVLQERGARVVERTPALRVAPGAVATAHGVVRSRRVVVTTGATRLAGAPGPAGLRRARTLATEPLPADVWEALGLAAGTTVVEDRHRPLELVRTVDDRLVAAGTPADLGRVADLLPPVRDHAVTHVWDTAQGVTGDGAPALGVDPADGIAWAVGAGADGPAVGNLAGRTLADLVTGADSALTELPWVRRPPAAARGRGAAALAAAVDAWSDRAEERRGRTPALARLLASRRPA